MRQNPVTKEEKERSAAMRHLRKTLRITVAEMSRITSINCEVLRTHEYCRVPWPQQRLNAALLSLERHFEAGGCAIQDAANVWCNERL